MLIPLFVVGTVAIAVLLVDNANLDNTAYGQSLLFPNAQNSSASPYLLWLLIRVVLTIIASRHLTMLLITITVTLQTQLIIIIP
ncbi:MAG: hypothetical protein DLM72_00880 [Candidatus Nitrosopolaris wilkensis]|nr:MAG: hypothetical protein DLM72_00880 [Candidatus Nitrosopolaris wilkensis]